MSQIAPSQENIWSKYVATKALPPTMSQEWKKHLPVAEHTASQFGGTVTWLCFKNWLKQFEVGNLEEDKLQALNRVRL